MRIRISFCLALCLLVSGLNAAEYRLVEKRRPNSRIQCNPAPDPLEYRAVTELQRYLKKITGAHVSRNTSNGNIWRVFRGESLDVVEIMPVVLENCRLLLPEKAVKRLDATKNPEAFYIISADSPRRGKSIFIAGKTPIAVLYGTNAFIEDYLGVRFFHAGPEGEYCPRKDTIVLQDLDDFREPWLRGRFMSCWSGSVKPWDMEDMREWLTRRTFLWNINHNYNDFSWEVLSKSMTGNQIPGGGGHLVYETSIPKSLFKTHPEFFPLQKGKRVCKDRSQRCFSNPEVRRRIIDFICWHTDYTPAYSIGFHDSTDGWCECPECIKYGSDKNGRYSLSNVTSRLANEIAAAVLKRNPKVKLTTSSYSDYRELPTADIQFVKEMGCDFCPHQRCYVHAFNDKNSDCNKYLFELFEKWHKHYPKMGIFDYYAYSQSPYCPMEYTLAKDMKYYHQVGLDFWIEDCTNKDLPIPSSNWQFYYIASKLAWDSDLDLDRLVDDMYTYYYGAANAPMKKYHALRRELWESAPGHALYGGGKRYGTCLLVDGSEKRLLGYLDQADKLAASDPMVKKRLAMDRKFLTEFWIAEANKIRKNMGASNHIPVAKRTGPVRIDAVLDEDAWRSARLVTPFQTTGKVKNDPVEETRVRILYDEDAWYIGIEAMMEHAWTKPVANVTARDAAVWKDDCVEIFIAPPSEVYYQLIVNPIGTLYDAQGRNVKADTRAELKTRVLKDRWILELRIPVNGLKREKIRSGEAWQFHFCRSCQNLQPPKSSEYSSIGGIEPHDQGMFRRANIGVNMIRNGDFSATEKVSENLKKRITSDMFPKFWGASGARMTVSKDKQNMIDLKDLVWTYFPMPKNGQKTKLAGEVFASGKGKLRVFVTGCVRPRGDRRPFGHEIKKILAVFNLEENPKSFPFSFEAEADAEYYINFRSIGGGDSRALIRGVSLSR